jgi:adenosylcobinamide kinase/adenosylcobinamide-phosphate guanylyltransferase
LEKNDQKGHLILVDCLTLWMSNLLIHDDKNLQIQECQKLLQILPKLESQVILVSNETGLGVVPMGEITRKFVDESGRLHQQLGQIADKVVFCVAGFPMVLKNEAL